MFLVGETHVPHTGIALKKSLEMLWARRARARPWPKTSTAEKEDGQQRWPGASTTEDVCPCLMQKMAVYCKKRHDILSDHTLDYLFLIRYWIFRSYSVLDHWI